MYSTMDTECLDAYMRKGLVPVSQFENNTNANNNNNSHAVVDKGDSVDIPVTLKFTKQAELDIMINTPFNLPSILSDRVHIPIYHLPPGVARNSTLLHGRARDFMDLVDVYSQRSLYFTNSAYRTIPNASHFYPIMAPYEFANIVAEEIIKHTTKE